jgi:uncharacterized OsmC-like protein
VDAAALRAAQAPLKDLYRQDAAAAVTPVRATGTFADDGITATIDGFAGPVRAGLHTATGGDGSDACSGDMLMEAILGCAGVTLRSVATAMGIPIRSASLVAESTFDARGTLGLDRSVPVGVGAVTVTATFDTDADQATLDRLGSLAERYCVVGQSLQTPPTIVVRRADGPLTSGA